METAGKESASKELELNRGITHTLIRGHLFVLFKFWVLVWKGGGFLKLT